MQMATVKLPLGDEAISLVTSPTMAKWARQNPNEQVLAFNDAALYYKGNGVWWISGYAWDGSDTNEVVERLKTQYPNCVV